MELGSILTVLSILSDMYTDSKERKAMEKKSEEEEEYQKQVEEANRKRGKDEYRDSKRGALGRAIESSVSLSTPRAPINYPNKPAPYKTQAWMNDARGLSSAARFLGSSGAGDQLQQGLGRYYDGIGEGMQSSRQKYNNYNTNFSPDPNRFA